MVKNKFNLNLILLWLLVFSFTISNAQHSVNTAGGNGTGSGGSIVYSSGQLVYTSHKSSSGRIDQGVQHAFVVINLGISGTSFDQQLTVYPNPTDGDLTLSMKSYRNEKLSYQICDIQGKILTTQSIKSPQSKVTMGSYSQANYFLYILDKDGHRVQSFKIIKE